MNWTFELLYELQEIENNIDALDMGFYDTHDLDYIEEHLDEYKDKLSEYSQYLPDKDRKFWEYEFKEGKIVLKS